MRPDQQRVQTLLTDTVTLLCKNGLQYEKELKVQGLLGITLDDNDVFVVHINKIFDEIQSKNHLSLMNSSSAECVKVSNIPPNVGDNESVSMFGTMCSSPLGESGDIHITNIPPSTTIGDYENVDGSYEQPKMASDVIPRRGIMPLHTSILSKSTTGVSKRKAGSNPRKRPIGAARRKQSAKHHRSDVFTSTYGIRVKDEQPEEIVVNPKDEMSCADFMNKDENSSGSLKLDPDACQDGLATMDMYPMSDSSMTYKSMEEYDNNSNSVDHTSDNYRNNEAVDMIECLLYNEAADQSESSHNNTSATGMYQKIRISGAEDSATDDGTPQSLAGCSGWEESQDAPSTPPTQTHVSVKSSGKSTASPSAMDDSVTYSGVQRQDINESLVGQYRDLLEAAAAQGDGYPCVECDQILKTRAIWMEHMKGVHMNRKYACPHCGETFKWRSSRKRHVLVTHSEENDSFRIEGDNLAAGQDPAILGQGVSQAEVTENMA